ncbi:HD-GYP domain-containing protein [Litchfieldia alkalitelluris]|uniref:HD-GYP domain-containing protein n=1 Tax=Litchfieldia alkalitelluris TaxID=304268 RepID=UPI000997B6EA|nr:HD-GYP domain-containing protein [Litchfieldia alkalitelluris]
MVALRYGNRSFVKNSIILIVSSTLIIIVFWVMLYLFIFPSIKDTADTSLKTQLELVKQHSLEEMKGPIDELKSLSSGSSLINSSPELVSHMVRKGFDSFSHFEQIGFIDHNLNPSYNVTIGSVNINHQKPILQMEDTVYEDQIFLSSFEYGINTAVSYLSIYIPVLDENKRYHYLRGTLEVSDSFFSPQYINQRLGNTGKVFLVDREGQIYPGNQVTSFSSELQDEIRKHVRSRFNPQKDGLDKVHTIKLANNNEQVLALKTLYNQLTIGIVYDQSEIYKAKLQLKNGFIIVSILLELIVIIVGVSVHRKLSKPTSLLIAQADKIANGDLDAPLPTTRDEDTSAIIHALQRVLNERERLFIQTIEAISSTLEKRDSYTAGHSKRVTDIALKIADELNLSDKEKRTLQLGAALHDIGKVGVPDSILLKTGRLTKEEYDEIKLHPVYGDDIIANIKSLKHVRPIVRSHHERWDGKGYPDGLAEGNIDLLARITCVADAFDAMISDRPYRTGMDNNLAIAVITEEAGKQFDPVIVEAFVRMAKKEYITPDIIKKSS